MTIGGMILIALAFLALGYLVWKQFSWSSIYMVLGLTVVGLFAYGAATQSITHTAIAGMALGIGLLFWMFHYSRAVN